jgi:iron-sulfur cluster repair protein YtfE (RIC family)
MKLTDALLGEHALFYKLFDHIDRDAASWDLAACQTWGRLLDETLESHAQIENRLLFDALEPMMGGMGPLAVMRMEHDSIGRCIHALPTAADAPAALALLREIVGTAREHFAKEENILFVMAERFLGAARLEELGAQWSEQRLPRFAAC